MKISRDPRISTVAFFSLVFFTVGRIVGAAFLLLGFVQFGAMTPQEYRLVGALLVVSCTIAIWLKTGLYDYLWDTLRPLRAIEQWQERMVERVRQRRRNL